MSDTTKTALSAEEAWRAFWEKRMLPDEAFIAPGYVGADDIAVFAEEYAKAVTPAPLSPAVEAAVERVEAQQLLSHATAGKEDFETVKVTAAVLRAALDQAQGEVERLLDVMKAHNIRPQGKSILQDLPEWDALRAALAELRGLDKK